MISKLDDLLSMFIWLKKNKKSVFSDVRTNS